MSPIEMHLILPVNLSQFKLICQLLMQTVILQFFRIWMLDIYGRFFYIVLYL
jgi:hypothetical protein